MEGTELLVPSKVAIFKLNKKSIFLLSLAAVVFILTIVAAIMFLLSGNKAFMCSLEFTYSGIESNLNPDGTVFSKQQLKSKEVLTEALASLNITNITPEKLDSHILVQSQFSKPKMEELAVTEYDKNSASVQSFYYTNKFYLTLVNIKEIGLSDSDARALVAKIAEVYKTQFFAKYVERQLKYTMTLEKPLTEYDYNEVGEIMNARISNLRIYSANMARQAGLYTGLESLNFPDINSSLDNISNVDIPIINQLAGSYYLTRDLGKLVKIYEYRIKQTELEGRKKQLEYEETKELLEIVRKPEDADMLSEGQSYNSARQNSGSYVQIVANDYYQFLVKKQADALVEYNRYEHLAEYYRSEINKYKNSGIPVDEVTRAKEQIDALIEQTDKTINEWYDTYNRVSTEFLNSSMNEGIKISDVVKTKK